MGPRIGVHRGGVLIVVMIVVAILIETEESGGGGTVTFCSLFRKDNEHGMEGARGWN